MIWVFLSLLINNDPLNSFLNKSQTLSLDSPLLHQRIKFCHHICSLGFLRELAFVKIGRVPVMTLIQWGATQARKIIWRAITGCSYANSIALARGICLMPVSLIKTVITVINFLFFSLIMTLKRLDHTLTLLFKSNELSPSPLFFSFQRIFSLTLGLIILLKPSKLFINPLINISFHKLIYQCIKFGVLGFWGFGVLGLGFWV